MDKKEAKHLLLELAPKLKNIEEDSIPALDMPLHRELVQDRAVTFEKWKNQVSSSFLEMIQNKHGNLNLEERFIQPLVLWETSTWSKILYSLEKSIQQLKIYKQLKSNELKDYKLQLEIVATSDTNILFRLFQGKETRDKVRSAKSFVEAKRQLIDDLDRHIETWSKQQIYDESSYQSMMDEHQKYYCLLEEKFSFLKQQSTEPLLELCKNDLKDAIKYLKENSKNFLIEEFQEVWHQLQIQQTKKDFERLPLEALSIFNKDASNLTKKITSNNLFLSQFLGLSVENLCKRFLLSESDAMKLRELVENLYNQTLEKSYPRLNPDDLGNLEIKLLNILKCFRDYSEEREQKEVDIARQLDNWFIKEDGIIRLAINRYHASRLSLTEYHRWCFLEKEIYEDYVEIEKQLVKLTPLTKPTVNKQAIRNDFVKNGATYFSLIEYFTGRTKTYQPNDLPSLIVEEVSNIQLDKTNLSVIMRPYQEFGAKYVLYNKNVLLGDEMGLGKTIQAIGIINHLYHQKLQHSIVVCPLSVIENWEREIKKWSKIEVFTFRGKHRDISYNNWRQTGGILLTNYEQTSGLAERCSGEMFDLIIVDEAHYIKNPEAKRTLSVSLLSKLASYKLFMTGTPLENRLYEMRHLIGLLNSDLQKKLETNIISVEDFKQSLSIIYLRRKRQDVLTELPDKEDIQLWSHLTEEEQKFYDEAVAEGLSGLMKMRRAAFYGSKSNKLLQIIDICSEAKENGQKVLIFSFFKTDVLYRLVSEIPDVFPSIISGDITPTQRQEIIDQFSESSTHTALLSQIDSGGVGLNIQSANVVILCEPQWKPSTEQQAISRVYRMGQTRNVIVYRLLTKESIDETMLEILDYKTELFNTYANDSVVADAFEKQLYSSTYSADELGLKRQVFEKERERLLAKKSKAS